MLRKQAIQTPSFRAAAMVLLTAFVLMSVPVYPADLTKQPASVSPAAAADAPRPTSEWNPFFLDGTPDAAPRLPPVMPLYAQLGPGASSGAPPAAPPPVSTPPPPPPNVKVNRTVPIVEPVPEFPLFTEAPTDTEITKARVFGEPFVPLGGQTTGEENRAFADAILAYLQNGNNEDTSALGAFLASYPQTAWRASLLANLGAHYQRTGYYTLAGETLQEAWELTREPSTPAGLAVALSALAELLDLKMKFGDVEELQEIVNQAEDIELHGTAVERMFQAKNAIYVLTEVHEEAIPSASVAVDNLLRAETPGYRQHPEITKFPAKHEGSSLAEVQALAARTGRQMEMVRRPVDQNDIPVPSIMHLKAGHFSALVKQAGERFLLLDPMLGGEMWFSRAALQQEASGYFLAPIGTKLPGWSLVTATQAQAVRGKCQGPVQGPGKPNPKPPCPGMAAYQLNDFLAALEVSDRPVGHTPPRGPAIQFETRYHQRDSNQPQTFSFSNLGRRWRFPWLSYLEDDPTNPNAQVSFIPGEGAKETYSGFDGTAFAPEMNSRAVLVRAASSPIRYERQLADGSLQVFSQSDGGVSPRRIFLTEWRDPQGNVALITFDSQLRIVSLTDALGQVATVSYELTADPLKVTKVTDPFGRFAKLEYNSDGALVRITDVIGIVSEMDYGDADFIRALTTPYGTTTFASASPYSEAGFYKRDFWVEATDPLGGKERIEYNWLVSSLPSTDATSTVPAGFINNVDLNRRNTFYWDKRATMLNPGDYTKANVMRWLWSPNNMLVVTDALHSQKKVLENRVWHGQQGESVPDGASPMGRASKVGRVLDDGTSQIYRYEYESQTGKITRKTDPLGRTSTYSYAANGVDLLGVRQINGQTIDLLETRTYNSQHRPMTVADPGGQTTSYAWDAHGRLLTVITPPRGGLTGAERTTTYEYYPEDATSSAGRLKRVTGPSSAQGSPTVTYTYDSFGRPRTATDGDGYALTSDSDALDRLTRVTYPDGTFEETVYNRLDAERQRDRLGRWSHAFHDALRRVVTLRDPLGRTATQQWCTCGSLDSLTDANGNTTSWERDLKDRITREVRPDGSAKDFVYENTTSRLKSVTDAKGQTVTYAYALDNNRTAVTYTNAQVATPNVSFTYDTVYGRRATMTDGSGTTTYGFQPIGALGAAGVSSIDGPLASDTITYGYDELGRIVSQQVSGAANSITYAYDSLGRTTSEANPLGTFSYAYESSGARLSSVTYPNGQTTTYAYFGHAGDHRLQDIQHKLSGGATLSRFQYTYDPDGNVKTWSEQRDGQAAQLLTLSYDAADQIVSAARAPIDPVLVDRFAYAYDRAGNRIAEQLDDAVTAAAYNNLDQLVSMQAGGALLFRGTVNEPATITVGGQPAQVDATNAFQGSTTVPSGTTNVAVVATDPSGNTRTNTFQVTQTGAAKTLTYDANGNLAGDGARTFEWDAEDRLVAIDQGTRRSEFSYDGSSRRVRIVEKDNGVVIGDRRFVWCGPAICEERDGTGSTVTRRFYDRGLQDGTSSLYATMDHLGSTRELTDGTGALRARYAYDPFGKATKLSGDRDAVFLFTGHLSQSNGGVLLTHYRAYDPGFGRWISRDPLDTRQNAFPYWSSPVVRWEQPGNVYAYANNEPSLFVDPDGRAATAAAAAAAGWVLLCGYGSWSYGKWEVSKGGPQPPGDPRNSQQTHCRAACRFNRCMLGALPPVVLAAQYGYELWHPSCDSDSDDRAAEYGLWVSYRWGSCANLCNTCDLPKDPC